MFVFGMYPVNYLLSTCTGYFDTDSEKLDAQLAIYLPYFKWSPPTGGKRSFPSLTDYAQPTVYSQEVASQIKRQSLPIAVHQMWLFVTGRSAVILSYICTCYVPLSH